MRCKIFLFILLTLELLVKVENANILGVFAFPGLSHFIMFRRLMVELANKGHNVDVVSHFPLEKPIARYTDISIKDTLPSCVNALTTEQASALTPLYAKLFAFTTAGLDVCRESFKSTQMKTLKETKKKYDLLITELFAADCMFGFGHHFKIPTIALTSSVNLPWGANRMGNPDNPAYIKTYFTSASSKMTLYERVSNAVDLIESKLLQYWYAESMDHEMKNFFGDDTPHVNDLVANISVLMVNSHVSISQAQPFVPNVIEVGGLHITEPQQLNEHFKNIIETDKKVIFFSLGSLISTDSFSLSTLQDLCDAFKMLTEYKILWRVKKENLPKDLLVPNNVHFEQWMPQIDILCHPNVRLFITHGGYMGKQEAIYCGVPTLGIPFFSDQELNINDNIERGISIKVRNIEITKESIFNAAKELLENPMYMENVKQLSVQFKDRLSSPLDTALYWVEYVLRYNGAPQLRSLAAEIPWFQYYFIDIIFVMLMFLVLILVLIRYFCKFVFKILSNHGNIKVRNKKDE